MTLNHPDLTELESLLRFSVLCKYPYMTGKCSRNRSISVHCTNKKARMCCCKYFSSEEAGNEQFRAVSSHCMQWDTESYWGNFARDESTILAVQGVTVPCKPGNKQQNVTAQQPWALRAAAGLRSREGFGQKSFWEPCRNLGEWTHRLCLYNFWFGKKNPILKIWLVPDVDWSLCVSWLWFKTINLVILSKLMCYNK